MKYPPLIPAKAGIQDSECEELGPASAGRSGV